MRFHRNWLALLTFATGTFACSLSQAESVTLPSRAEVHRPAADEAYAALSVQLPASEATRDVEQVLVLVDTSASQVGEFRERTLALTNTLLGQLTGRQVSVWAVDVAHTPLTDGLVALDQAAIDSVNNALADRIPAGSTNLAAVLESATSELSADKTSAIIYVGDGFSAANLIAPEQLNQLTGSLAKRQIPFISYALGAQTDLQLLGILALRSGGVVLTDSADQEVAAAASQLNKALSAPVWYPESMQVSEGVILRPETALPVRADRETIYLAEISDAAQIQLTLSAGETEATAEFSAEVAEGHNALRALFQRAAYDNGLSVPTAGQVVLDAAKDTFEQHVAVMLEQANEAANAGRAEQSVQISQALLQLDPKNAAASKLLNVQQTAMLQPAEEAAPPIVTELDDLEQQRTDAPTALEQDLIEQYRNRSKVAGERLRLQVSQAIDQARSIIDDDPNAAISELKGILGAVRSAADIDPEIRQELERRVGNVVLEVRARREQIQNQRVRLEQELAEQEARRRVIEEMMLEEERLEQLIDQVRALLDDGYHGDVAAYAEAEAVAEAAVALVPFAGVSNSARFTAEAAGQLEDARYLRALRADRFLETLTQVEFSHVPFPDEPPVRWPSAPVWKALTERRKVWASVDLKDDTPAERRIRNALDEETELQFVDTPLQDALDIIGELHNITIKPKDLALEDAGISTDEPVTLFISGVRLRSALKLMLEKMPEPLTWVVEDEVMKITTVLDAELILETRVYPVADLVIPIQTLGGGAQGGGGLVGGANGFGGQQGGQQGGFGGGAGGGGFGGGGFFSIPAPAVDVDAKKKH